MTALNPLSAFDALHFAGSDVSISASDLTDDLREALIDCGAPGDATAAVDYVMSRFAVTGDADDCAAMLRGYGAWESEELAEHDRNLARLVWLTGCSLREGEDAYFSTYA